MSVAQLPNWPAVHARANEAEHTHIMLDLDAVADAAGAARFLMRHGATLRDMLLSTEPESAARDAGALDAGS